MTQPTNKRFVMEDSLATQLALKSNIATPTFTGGVIVSTGDISVSAGGLNAVNSISSSAGSIVGGSAGTVSNVSTTHAVQAGPTSGLNTRIGNDGSSSVIAAVNNGTYNALSLNPSGNVQVGGASSVITIAGAATAQKNFTTATGDGTIAPLKIPAGTLMGTPTAQVLETDANAFYGTTNATHGRSVIVSNLFSSGTKTYASQATAQNIFPTPGGTLAMSANTTYMVEGLIHISVPATSSAAHTMSLTLNGGTAGTTGQIMAIATQNNTSAVAIPTVTASYLLTATTASTIWATASTAATAVYRTVFFNGIIRCSTAGTFIPQFTTSVASVAIPAGTTNNYIKLTPMGTNSVAAIGAWT